MSKTQLHPMPPSDANNGRHPARATKTKLGAKLAALRAEIVESGEPLLDWNDIAQEIVARRGEHDTDLH